MEEKLLTIAEVAQKFRISKGTVQRWVRENNIEAIYAGNKYLIPEREMLRIYEELKTERRQRRV